MRTGLPASRQCFTPFKSTLKATTTSRRAGSSRVMAASEDIKQWPKQDKRRFLHAVYRVGNLEATIDYYQKHFGMKQLRYRDVPEEKYRNAFLGYGPEDTNFCLELTENYDKDSYDLGTGFGHFALALPDVYKTCESIKKAGGKISRDAGPVKGGKTVIAFVEDPTGYKWELITREEPIKEPIAQVMLRVTDLDRSIKFYTEALGMTLIRTRDNPDNKYKLAFLGYGPEDETCVYELTYNYGQDKYDNFKGEGYAQVAMSTEDVYKTAEAVQALSSELGGKVVREAGPLPVLNTKITSVVDPDGWKTVFVDNKDFLAEL